VKIAITKPQETAEIKANHSHNPIFFTNLFRNLEALFFDPKKWLEVAKSTTKAKITWLQAVFKFFI
jgi:hypothetical protein